MQPLRAAGSSQVDKRADQKKSFAQEGRVNPSHSRRNGKEQEFLVKISHVFDRGNTRSSRRHGSRSGQMLLLLFSLVLGGKKSLKSYMQCAYDRGLRSHEEGLSPDALVLELRVYSGLEEGFCASAVRFR